MTTAALNLSAADSGLVSWRPEMTAMPANAQPDRVTAKAMRQLCGRSNQEGLLRVRFRVKGSRMTLLAGRSG